MADIYCPFGCDFYQKNLPALLRREGSPHSLFIHCRVAKTIFHIDTNFAYHGNSAFFPGIGNLPYKYKESFRKKNSRSVRCTFTFIDVLFPLFWHNYIRFFRNCIIKPNSTLYNYPGDRLHNIPVLKKKLLNWRPLLSVTTFGSLKHLTVNKCPK